MACAHCGDTGWKVKEVNGFSGAERCFCKTPQLPTTAEMRDAIMAAVVHIADSRLIPFFPRTEEAWIVIVAEIQSFIADARALDLFLCSIFSYCEKYEGVAGLRRIYRDVALSAAKLDQMDENARSLAQYRRQAQLAPAGEREIFLLPEAKPVEAQPATPPARRRPSIRSAAASTRTGRPLKDREEELTEAIKNLPPRSEGDRARLAGEVLESLQGTATVM